MTELYAGVIELGRLFVNKENGGSVSLQVIFRSYFFAAFFVFLLVFLGTILASIVNFVDFPSKSMCVTNPYTDF